MNATPVVLIHGAWLHRSSWDAWAALLTGREDDFTLMLTLAYTGLRWGEIIGLEDSFLRHGEIRVEWQIREVGGKFYRLPPKDDSYRSPAWEPCLPVDLPPFLAALLTRQVGSLRHRCACAPEHGGSGRYVFPPRTAATIGGATTAAGRSAPPATDGTSLSMADRRGSSPSTPPPGPGPSSPPGQPPHRATRPGAVRRTTFRRAGTGSGSFRMAFRWPPGYRWFPA